MPKSPSSLANLDGLTKLNWPMVNGHNHNVPQSLLATGIELLIKTQKETKRASIFKNFVPQVVTWPKSHGTQAASRILLNLATSVRGQLTCSSRGAGSSSFGIPQQTADDEPEPEATTLFMAYSLLSSFGWGAFAWRGLWCGQWAVGGACAEFIAANWQQRYLPLPPLSPNSAPQPIAASGCSFPLQLVWLTY